MADSNHDKRSMIVFVLASIAALAASFAFVVLPRLDMTKLTRVALEGTNMSVMLPAAPSRQVKMQQTEIGELESVEFTVGSSLLLYAVIYTDFPDDDSLTAAPVEEIFRRAIDPLLAKTNGTISAEKDVRYGDIPGKDVLLVTKSKIHIRTRFYMAGKRFIQLYVMTTADRIKDRKTDEFIESLEIE